MTVELLPYHVEASGLSDVGLIRENNEDVFATLPHIPFFALADGMGGHVAGEVAAAETVHALCDLVERQVHEKPSYLAGSSEVYQLLKSAIQRVNRHVYQMSARMQELNGMGTTLCCLLFHKEGLTYAHVGDSRIYRFRNNTLELLTQDHSLLKDLLKSGNFEEKKKKFYKNIITRAMGTGPRVSPTIGEGEVREGDVYMMCSDGLSDLLTLREMQLILSGSNGIAETAPALITSAKKKGGHDNITVVLTEVKGEADLSR
jgi:protein phosphatase